MTAHDEVVNRNKKPGAQWSEKSPMSKLDIRLEREILPLKLVPVQVK